MTRLEREGIRYRARLRTRLLRFDDIERLDGARAVSSHGERVALPPEAAGAVARVLRGPDVDGSLVQVGAAFAAHVAGPHGPRLAARHLIDAATALAATDIHLEAGPDDCGVRMRLAGELTHFCRLPADDAARIIAALKGLAGCLPYRKDIAQEGRIQRAGVCADVRASFVPTPFGERAALRLFGRLLGLDELGFEPALLSRLRRLLEARTGLLLVAGSTGAGKTTTLYAALGHVAAARTGAHLSLEDPVEQRLRAAAIPVDQIELDPARGLTAESMLVAALRQDVDVLGVGEIRTFAEARLAVEAAHTGRLVLAGVHAGSCAEARQRMLDLGVAPDLLAVTLRGVLHQGLQTVPCGCGPATACPRCRGLRRRRALVAELDVPGEAPQQAAALQGAA